MMAEKTEFSWVQARNEGLVIVPEQAAIAVYENPNGDVILRQEAQIHSDEDQCICVQYLYLPRLIAALEQIRIKKQRANSE